MKAIIMAGGEGSRLRPLTCTRPKPMVPLLDRPVLAYSLELLRRHGVREAAATLMYLPECVTGWLGDGSRFGLNVRCYIEETPMGTAGSVRRARDFLDETFVVLSGDGVTDCDLSAAYAWHKEHAALATVVLKHVEHPLEYGVVIADANGRVTRFVEKPGWGEVFSDTVNTGIYILEPEVLDMIPENIPFDFSRDLFSKMLERGDRLCAWVMNGYWCDIGDTAAYLKAHADLLDGRVNLSVPGRQGGVVRMPGAQVDRGAVLEGPCFIGRNAVIEAGARIGAYSVVGEGCVVCAGASLKRAVLWEGSRVETGAQVRASILAEGARMQEGSSAFEESVLGRGSVLGACSSLMPGVKVWPQKRVEAGLKLDANVVWGSADRPLFSGGELTVEEPEEAMRAARAAACVMKMRRVLLGRAPGGAAQAGALALQAGFMAQGVQIYDGGCATRPQLRCQMRQLGLEAALHFDGRSIRIWDAAGAEIDSSTRRGIETALRQQEYAAAFAAGTRLIVSAGRGDLIYLGMLKALFKGKLQGQSVPLIALYAPGEQLLSLAERAFEEAGCCVRAEWEEEMMELSPGEIGIWLSEDGESMTLADETGCLSESEGQLMLLWAALEMGCREPVLPSSATRAAEELAARYNRTVKRVGMERSAFMRALAGQNERLPMLYFDGIYAALTSVALLAEYGLAPREWARSMPTVARCVRSVPLSFQERGSVLHALIDDEAHPDVTEGLCVERDGAWASVLPSGARPECRVVAEAADMETADELCAFYEGKIRTLLRRRATESEKQE